MKVKSKEKFNAKNDDSESIKDDMHNATSIDNLTIEKVQSSIPEQIRNINFEDPTEEEKEIIATTISEHFLDNYSQYEGISEIAKSFNKDKFHFLGEKDYSDEFKKGDNEEIHDNDLPPGYYNFVSSAIYLNKDSWQFKNYEAAYDVLLHEAFHYFGIENGAGADIGASTITVPERFSKNDKDDEKQWDLFKIGVTTICEGATNYLSHKDLYKMGFQNYIDTYKIETSLAHGIEEIIGEKTFEKIFFTMPLEEVRLRFESISATEKELEEPYFVNGEFARFLVAVGACAQKCNKLLGSLENTENQVSHFVTNWRIRKNMNKLLDGLENYITQE